jgi:hypothetical protein
MLDSRVLCPSAQPHAKSKRVDIVRETIFDQYRPRTSSKAPDPDLGSAAVNSLSRSAADAAGYPCSVRVVEAPPQLRVCCRVPWRGGSSQVAFSASAWLLRAAVGMIRVCSHSLALRRGPAGQT